MSKFDDEYIANLMKEEALEFPFNRKPSSALSIRSFKTKPKLNTRFLQNIVRDVDSHNAALSAREASESRSRLKMLQDSHGENSLPFSKPGRHYWSRNKRLRSDSYRGRVDYLEHQGKRHKNHINYTDIPSRHQSNVTTAPQQSPGPNKSEVRQREHGNLENGNTRHRRSRRSLENTANQSGPGHHQRLRSVSPDSLEEFIGPHLPSYVRGRGTLSAGAIMDNHFKENYNPRIDIDKEPMEQSGWNDSVKGYRDRQRWKQQGAQRLREAGFDERFITAWETNSINDEANLKWSMKGDTREWDKGKPI